MLAPFFWFRGLLGAFILESPGFTRGYNCFAPPELENCASRLRCFCFITRFIIAYPIPLRLMFLCATFFSLAKLVHPVKAGCETAHAI